MYFYIREHLFASTHAFKHGLSVEDIDYAWTHFVVRQRRRASFNDEVIAIGPRRNRNLIQMVASEQTFGVVIFHALEPPTQQMLHELGIWRR